MSDLPTKPGHYYWRRKDGDGWRIIQVYLAMLNDEPEVNGMCCESPLSGEYVHVSEIDGEWLPIPTAEELVELQSAKKMVDESREQWQIWNPCHSKLVMVGRTEDEAITAFRKSIKSNNPPEPWSQFLAAGYTCRKVRVCQEVES